MLGAEAVNTVGAVLFLCGHIRHEQTGMELYTSMY